jgi:hypothetical protein
MITSAISRRFLLALTATGLLLVGLISGPASSPAAAPTNPAKVNSCNFIGVNIVCTGNITVTIGNIGSNNNINLVTLKNSLNNNYVNAGNIQGNVVYLKNIADITVKVVKSFNITTCQVNVVQASLAAIAKC